MGALNELSLSQVGSYLANESGNSSDDGHRSGRKRCSVCQLLDPARGDLKSGRGPITRTLGCETMSSAVAKSAGVAFNPTRAELEAIFNLTDDGFVVYDDSGSLREANKRVRSLLQLSDTEWAGVHDFPALARLLSARLANDQQAILPPWEVWRRGNDLAREQLELADGAQTLERIVLPVRGNGENPAGWVECYRNSPREREFPAYLSQIDKLASLGTMVASIAHELNNPLTSVMGYSQILLDRSLDRQALIAVQNICREAERAEKFVLSLLHFSREARLERTPVNLNEIVERTLRLCLYDLQHAGITVSLDLDPLLPSLHANSVQLQQVVLNLLVNGQQAITESGRPGRILLQTSHTAEHVLLRVEDNGPGIPREIRPRIFEPFFTTKGVDAGTGLGLFIVAGIVRSHNGEIHVGSSPCTGAKFVIELPVAQVPQSRGPGAPSLKTSSTDFSTQCVMQDPQAGLGRPRFFPGREQDGGS